MDDRVLTRLRCPVCAEPLTGTTAGTTRALRCPRGHSFDTARQGYVNLLAGRSPHTGDSADMVAARADFLAAGHYDTVAAALADTWQRLPLADRSVTVLLNVFAPRNGPEFHRVLDPGGALLVVTPAADHLAELVEALGLLRVDPAKADRVAGSLGAHFSEESATGHRARLMLTRAEVTTLVGMGPSAWHAEPERLGVRIAALPEPVSVTLSVRLGVHRPR
ncbi:putative RNA methyltransferase [Micromonospora echinospora]|uniref:putative RNA methyltransferase n=1 Tax=Micromonospora echinospora TaxID=1877 RepID=UPI0034356110